MPNLPSLLPQITVFAVLLGCTQLQAQPNVEPDTYAAKGELGLIEAETVATFAPAPHTDTIAIIRRESADRMRSDSRLLSLYDGTTGAPLWSRPLTENYTYSLSFSANGRWVAVAGVATAPVERREFVQTHGVVRVFDARTGLPRNVLTVEPTGFIHSLALAPKEPLLAVGGNGWIEFWNFSTGKRLARVAMKGEVTSLDFSPDGTRLASASLWSPPTLWSVKTRRRVVELPYQGKQTFAVAFSPNGRTLALAGNAFASLYTVSGHSKRWKTELNYSFDPSYRRIPGSLSFSSDGRFLAVSGIAGGVLNASSGKLLYSLRSTRLHFGLAQQLWGVGPQSFTSGNPPKDVLLHWPAPADWP